MNCHAIHRRPAVLAALALLCAGLLGSAAGRAAEPSGGGEPPGSRSERIAELERAVEVLAEELDSLRVQVAVPETKELVSRYGLGPAASKVYGIERGLSIGGYGEAYYTNFQEDGENKKNTSDFLRFVAYIGYKFSDRIVLNSEIEFEHATTSSNHAGSSGSVSVEFATLDFLWSDAINFRAGMLLLPMGFINEIHESPYFHGVQRPEVERRILPSTSRENGAGFFGELGGGLSWRAYVVAGFDGAQFSDSGIRSGRQKGNRVLAEDLALTLRMDWTPAIAPGLLLGGSFYTGGVDHNQEVNGNKLPDSRLNMWDLRLQFRRGPFHARALYANSTVSRAAELSTALGQDRNRPVAKTMSGYYVEAAWDLWPAFGGAPQRALKPFVRWERVNTQDDVPAGYTANLARDYHVRTIGIGFHPLPDVALKLEYRDLDPADSRASGRDDEISIGIGFAF